MRNIRLTRCTLLLVGIVGILVVTSCVPGNRPAMSVPTPTPTLIPTPTPTLTPTPTPTLIPTPTPTLTLTPTPTSTPTVKPTPAAPNIYTLALSPTSGPAGTTITVTGKLFGSSTYNVFLDVNRNGAYNIGEPTKSVTTSPTGSFSTTLTVSSVPPVTYMVLAAFPNAAKAQAAASFAVTGSSSMTLNPTSGAIGTTITVTGRGLSASTYGNVFFDTNSNYIFDSGESLNSLTTSPTGTFSTTLSVLPVAPGTYSIVAAFPSGAIAQASASFTVTTTIPMPKPTGASLTLSPDSGSIGATITVGGDVFTADTSGNIFFDVNRNGISDVTELVGSVTTSPTGAFSMDLNVPPVPPGTYMILAAFPAGFIQATTTFTVTANVATGSSIVLSSASGPIGTTITITGGIFTASTYGNVFFDVNRNGVSDVGEPVGYATTSSSGTFSTTLDVPPVLLGTYMILAAFPIGVPVQATASFTVTTPP